MDQKSEERSDDQDPFQIDPRDLGSEWIRQPRLMRAAGRREADARHDHAQAKARVGVVAARLRLKIRQDPGSYGLREKPTVDEIESCLELQKEYRNAVDEMNESKKDLDYAETDTVAFIDRRKALENLVELLGLEYRSEKEPSTRSASGREEAERRVRDAVRRRDG